MGVQNCAGLRVCVDGCPGLRTAPASGASLAFLVSFGDLERGVCSSIGRLRPRIREPEGGSAPASVSEFAKRFDGCPGFRRRNAQPVW